MSDEIKCKECGVVLTLPYEQKYGAHWFNSDCVKNLQSTIASQSATIAALKANSIALADHARFMSEAHDGGRCKAALKNHADLMEKLKEAGI